MLPTIRQRLVPSLARCQHIRSFTTTRALRAEEAEGAAEDAESTLSPSELKREQWLDDNADNYETAPSYTGGDTPFPLNPFFKVTHPLNTQTRIDIYEKFVSDPNEWTPRRLAEAYGISIIRVEAILRLRAQAAKMEKKGKLETAVGEGMDVMLKSVYIKYDENEQVKPREKLRFTRQDGLRPFFQMIEEEDSVTPEDAATMMGLEPHANIQFRRNRAADRTFQIGLPGQTTSPTLRKDKDQRGKTKLMFTDVGRLTKTPPMFMREKDGKLRNATKLERLLKTHVKPAMDL